MLFLSSYCRRWNSTFDCLNDLIIVKQFLGSVCDALELPKFKDTDLEFLTEYIKCVKPITEALNRLQGEKNSFMANFYQFCCKRKRICKNYNSGI